MKNTFVKDLWSFLTSLKLAITILISISATSIIGTVIPQNESAHFYHEYYKPSVYKFIKLLSLDDMYHAWWFTTLLALFTLNLICCAVKRFPGFWKFIKKEVKDPDDQFMQSLPLKRTFYLKKLSDKTIDEVSRIVQKHVHAPTVRDTSPDNFSLFAEKGKYSRLSFYITHIGIILIILGGIAGNLGFQGYMKLIEGETSDTIILRGSSQKSKLDFSIRCDDFEATFYPGSKRPKDYKSTLTIIDGGKEVLSKVIEVNDPLSYKGVYIYQSSYGTASGAGEVLLGVTPKAGAGEVRKYRVKIGGRFALDEKGYAVKVKRFVPDFTIGADNQVISRSQELRNPAVQLALFKDNTLLNENWIFANFQDFHGARDSEFQFSFLGFFGKEYTGLQLTRDPGVWVVWTGCFLLTLGSYLIFFTSHRRLWVRVEPKDGEYLVTVAGTSNKNLELFAKVFEELYQELRKTGKKT